MALGGAPSNQGHNQGNNQGNNQGKKNNQPKNPEAGSFVSEYNAKVVAKFLEVGKALRAEEKKLSDGILKGGKEADSAGRNFVGLMDEHIEALYVLAAEAPSEADVAKKLNGRDKSTEMGSIGKVQEKIENFIKRTEDKYGLSYRDQRKKAEERSPEQVDKENVKKLGKILEVIQESQTKLLTIFSRLEERKKTNKKLSDEEKLRYELEIDVLRLRIQTTYSEFLALDELEEDDDFRLRPDRDPVQEKIMDIIEATFQGLVGHDDPDSSVISKIIAALEKPVDETKEKFPEFGKEMDSIQQGFSQIQKEIEDLRKGADKKVDEEYRPGLENRINQEVSKLEVLKQGYSEAWDKLALDLADQGKSPTEKQRVQYSSILSRASYLDTLSKKLYEKVKEGVDKKDQRENVKSIAGRVTDVEKMMKDDYDKLEIGKKYEDGQRATYTLLLDSEIISARDARKELRDLVDEEENQPTKTTLEKQLDDIDKRIKKLEGKVDKERVAKEKEVKEKLDAAEAEIEKMEDKIREEKAKEAAGKLKVAENLKPESQEKLGVLNKLWSPLKYKNGLTYHDQKNVNDSLADPKEDIAKAKEWIDKMPEETEKELKLKKRLMKKARRMSSRRRSVMIRHFFMISNTEKAKLAGNAIFQATTNFAADKFDAANDSIFSRRDAA